MNMCIQYCDLCGETLRCTLTFYDFFSLGVHADTAVLYASAPSDALRHRSLIGHVPCASGETKAKPFHCAARMQTVCAAGSTSQRAVYANYMLMTQAFAIVLTFQATPIES